MEQQPSEVTFRRKLGRDRGESFSLPYGVADCAAPPVSKRRSRSGPNLHPGDTHHCAHGLFARDRHLVHDSANACSLALFLARPRAGAAGVETCMEVDQARAEHSGRADSRSWRGSCGARGRCRGHRRSRVGLVVPHPGVTVRRRGGKASRSAEVRAYRGCAECGARIRRFVHVSRVRYPRNRIESALLKGSLPGSCRIMPARHLPSPLGSLPADSRFCSRDAGSGYTVVYASPDFATAFVETVVRDRFTRRRNRDVGLNGSRWSRRHIRSRSCAVSWPASA